VNNALIRNRIEAGDILDFATDSLSQHGVTGRPIYLYASRVAIRRLVNKQTHLNTQGSDLIAELSHRFWRSVAIPGPFTVPIARCCFGCSDRDRLPPHPIEQLSIPHCGGNSDRKARQRTSVPALGGSVTRR
jgi:hypothetical protein